MVDDLKTAFLEKTKRNSINNCQQSLLTEFNKKDKRF